MFPPFDQFRIAESWMKYAVAYSQMSLAAGEVILQRSLRMLIDQPELREKMGEAGRKYVLANFDRKTRLQRTLALYEWALRRRGI